MLALSSLVAARLIESLTRRRKVRTREGMVRLLIELSSGGPLSDPRLIRFARDPRLAARALVEFSTLLRGAELKQALVKLQQVQLSQRLVPLVGDANRETRLVAIEALGLIADDRAKRALLRVVERSPSVQESITAACALQAAGFGPGLPVLLSGLRLKRTDAPAELASVLAAAALDTPGALEDALDDATLAPSVRLQIITAIGASGRFESLATLRRLALHADPAVRAAAVSALGGLGHPDAADILAEATTDADPDVRAEAAGAIGEIAAASLAPVLRNLLDDPAWPVRFNAAAALNRLGPVGIDTLREAAAAPVSPRAGRAAIMTLAEGTP